MRWFRVCLGQKEENHNHLIINDFINETCKNFGVKPKPFEYYLADDYDEIQALKGLDYYIGMGGQSKPRGKATDDKVYCGGLGEYYPHEVFHVQIDEHFPHKHFWVSEGVATLLGGSRGKSLDWHIKRTNIYLQKHSELDLNDMLKLTNLDSETSYHYVLGGLIARKIMDKGGWALLKEFMSQVEKLMMIITLRLKNTSESTNWNLTTISESSYKLNRKNNDCELSRKHCTLSHLTCH